MDFPRFPQEMPLESPRTAVAEIRSGLIMGTHCASEADSTTAKEVEELRRQLRWQRFLLAVFALIAVSACLIRR
jgi:hypothetical protein